jgi:site-specific DNA-methyltransferase (adenine-specific)
VALFEYLIRTYTRPSELVLDNCLGSGTTAIAAINEGRCWIGIEQDEKYFEVARKRIEEHAPPKPEEVLIQW